MKYYKVKKEHDNKRYVIKSKKTGHYTTGGFLIANELLTEREFQAIECVQGGHLGATIDYFDVVDVPRGTVYYFFGARFTTIDSDNV